MLSKLQEFRWITKFGPCFPVDGNKIQILTEPSIFYEQLNILARSAQRRIVLAALYLGDGHLESQLVESMRSSLLKESASGLKVHVLLDYTRGSRGGPKSSRAMLAPLIQEYPRSMRVSLYHSPHLRGFLRYLLPERWNEVVGLQHIKVYIFDDDLIISGANLSDQYFRQRQDRYVKFENCSNLCDYFEDLVSTVGKFSLQLNKSNELNIDKSFGLHPYKSPLSDYIEKAKDAVSHLLKPNLTDTDDQCDTLVSPLIQMGPFGITQDQQVTSRLLEQFNSSNKVRIATGYFNLVPGYEGIIAEKSSASYDVLTAAPIANSFYKSRGFSCLIPSVYTYYLREFYLRITGRQSLSSLRSTSNWNLFGSAKPVSAGSGGEPVTLNMEAVLASGSSETLSGPDVLRSSSTDMDFVKANGEQASTGTVASQPSLDVSNRVQCFEYIRPYWTFHGKGLWWWRRKDDQFPMFTLVGSPNFGYRSVNRDLEAQVAILTTNKSLQKQLYLEQQRLFDGSQRVTDQLLDAPERRIPWIVRILAPYVRSLF